MAAAPSRAAGSLRGAGVNACVARVQRGVPQRPRRCAAGAQPNPPEDQGPVPATRAASAAAWIARARATFGWIVSGRAMLFLAIVSLIATLSDVSR